LEVYRLFKGLLPKLPEQEIENTASLFAKELLNLWSFW